MSIEDGLFAVGAASVSYGAWLIYQPAGFVVGGLLLIGGGYAIAKIRGPNK